MMGISKPTLYKYVKASRAKCVAPKILSEIYKCSPRPPELETCWDYLNLFFNSTEMFVRSLVLDHFRYCHVPLRCMRGLATLRQCEQSLQLKYTIRLKDEMRSSGLSNQSFGSLTIPLCESRVILYRSMNHSIGVRPLT